MRGDVERACEALRQRKLAATGAPEETVGAHLTVGEARSLYLGFEVELDEVFEAAEGYANNVMLTLALGLSRPDLALPGLWADGFATGLMLGDLRAQQKARA